MPLAVGKRCQEIGEGSGLAARKCREAHGTGHGATNFDKLGDVPGSVSAARGKMIGDDGFEICRKLPIGDELTADFAVIPAVQFALGLENGGGGSAMRFEQLGVGLGLNYGEGHAPDIVKDA